MLEGRPELGMVIGACDAMERCAERGGGTRREKGPLDAGAALRHAGPRDADAVAQGVWWAVDSARAAEAALDFPVDATVTNSALNAVRSLAQDRRVSGVQLAALVGADMDLIGFSCGEAKVGTYDGLTRYVFERLTPVHSIALNGARGGTGSGAR